MLSSHQYLPIKQSSLSINMKELNKTNDSESAKELPQIVDQSANPSTFLRIDNNKKFGVKKFSLANREIINSDIDEDELNRVDSHDMRFFNQRLGS